MPRPKKKKQKPQRKGCLGSLFRVGIKLGIVTILMWTVVGLGYYAWALTFDLSSIAQMPERSTVYDHNGRFYSRLAGENRIVVPFDKVSNHFINALLAREDTRFYKHHGVDPIGIARAIARNFIAGGFRQGASTITQQLARNSFPLGGKNLHRKLIEAALAYRIETELSKEDILEAYMNRIYLGSGFYGVEAASRAYFGKPASRMDLPEAAMLAGLIRSPSRFSPFRSLKKAVRERDAVLNRMANVGFISEAEKAEALASRPKIATPPASSPQENWAMDTILEELRLVLDQDQIDSGGLNIHTTIAPKIQMAAEASLSRRLKEVEHLPAYSHKKKSDFAGADFSAEGAAPYLEGAAIALDSRNGGIRAIVGGRDLHASSFNRALHGRRQIGSAIKPFVYAKAIERGLNPRQRISDDRILPGEIPKGMGPYNPSNYDNTYRGELPAEEGLILSRNTMTVRVGLFAGLDAIAESVRISGISQDPPRYPALCLGAFESNLKDLTSAYTVFATGGTKIQPYLIEKVTDSRGHLLYRATHGKIAVLEPLAAKMTAGILRDVVNRGTASAARQLRVHRGTAGKTGTTNDYHDAWFIGFDDALTCGVWVGFDQPKKIMSGGSGAQLALPIWADIMNAQ